jgi:hypothetical protein
MKQGMKEPCRKGDSDSILTASFARAAARRHVKHKQRHRWAGYRASKIPFGNADSLLNEEGDTGNGAIASRGWVPRSRRPRAR